MIEELLWIFCGFWIGYAIAQIRGNKPI